MQVVFDVIIKLGIEKREDKLIIWTILSTGFTGGGVIRGGWREKAMGGQERKRGEGVKGRWRDR